MDVPRRTSRVPVPKVRDDEIASFDSAEIEEAIPPEGVLQEETDEEDNEENSYCTCSSKVENRECY